MPPLVNVPRGQMVNRSAPLKAIETDDDAMLDQLADLILLLDGGETGQRFQAAWQRARGNPDAGHGPAPEETPTPTTLPTP